MIQRAASIGVSVKETIKETAIAAAEVNPNEDMKRPTMPDINPTGMKTASKRKRRRHDGQANLFCALNRRLKGMHPLLFHKAVDVFQNDDGVVNHDADHQGQGEHRHLVERIAERGNQREGRDD